jgi:tRNA/tmRNA/rRNA uracil-C5-methylase (TrmA/RlmC/RlmD family)
VNGNEEMHVNQAGVAGADNGGEVVEVVTTDVSKDGAAVGRVESRAVFVRHGIPGERVRVRLDPYKEKDRWLAGDVVDVIDPSPHRVPHVWSQADVLLHGPDAVPGGAEFGHIALSHQRELKAGILEGQLRRLAGIDPALIGFTGVEPAEGETEDGLRWRTRAAFGVDAEGRPAMRARASHRLIPTPSFPLAVEAVDALGLGETDLSGLQRVEIAVPSAGEPLVLLVPDTRTVRPSRAKGSAKGRRGRGPRPREEATAQGTAAVHRVAGQLPHGVSAAMLVQTGGAAADGAGSLTGLVGSTDLTERVGENSFRVTGEGFWQVHHGAPATLTRAVMDLGAPAAGESWADLYGGAGLFSVPLARAVTRTGSMVSVEGAPGTHRDAVHNLGPYRQARAVHGRVERVLASLTERVDGVVLDPPRAGAGARAVGAIAELGPETVVYVACDPSALAKDAARFGEAGYRMTRLRAFDLYPHTHHLEAVAVFSRA